MRTPDGQATLEGWQLASEATTNPTTANLASLAAFAVYMKADKFVIAYNSGGTMKYITIPMDGSTTVWTHGSGAP